jgi:formylglycine-generating enzyme required for sulfatase activity
MKLNYFIRLIISALLFLSIVAFSPLRAIAAHQRITKRDVKFHKGRGKPTAHPRIFTNRYGMKLVLVPAGSFQMGLSEREAQMIFERFLKIDKDTKLKWFSNATPKHQVEIRHSFYMGQTEVTQNQWRAVMGKTIREQRDEDNPNSMLYGEGDGYPIYYVSWNEAKEFVARLNSSRDGFVYRLPSEAEWEYARRAGTTESFTSNLDSIAWYLNNSGRTRLDVPEIVVKGGENYVKLVLDNGGGAHPVGTKRANSFGLYDMTGNVWEWCEDVSHENYQGAPTDGSSWVTGGNPKYRVLRGGSWIDDTSNLHSSYRTGFAPEGHSFQHGFRIAANRR